MLVTLTVMRCIRNNWRSWSAVMIQMQESTKVRIGAPGLCGARSAQLIDLPLGNDAFDFSDLAARPCGPLQPEKHVVIDCVVVGHGPLIIDASGQQPARALWPKA
jgi:hypothetical protein